MKRVQVLSVLSLIVLLSSCGAIDPQESAVEQQESALTACTVSQISLGTRYSQNNPAWGQNLLGNSPTVVIGQKGGIISSLAIMYTNIWGMPTTTPAALNTSAKAAGCFGPGSADVDASCAANSRGGVQHVVTDIALSSVRTTLCANTPVLVDVTFGGGHGMLVYSYNGGDVNALSSYVAADPWNGQSKTLSGYTATRWRRLSR